MELDPDRRLALAYVPASRRRALEALWRLDVTLGSILATGRDPMIIRIRLAWWREALAKLDHAPPPAEPVLGEVASHLIPARVSGVELADMEQGWAAVLPSEHLTEISLAEYAAERGGRLFRYSARLLGGAEDAAAAGGEAWALVDLARRSSSASECVAALEAAARIVLPTAWPKPLRPLGMLAVLASRDAKAGALEPQGSPARVARMIRHRLTGR